MSKRTPDTKVGKWFENKKMTPALDGLVASHTVFKHKLKDSHSAGRMTSSSPADYLIAYKGKGFLVECKASTIHPSLRSCLASAVDDGQIGEHTFWMRAGMNSLFVFYSDLTGLIEFWDGADVVKARITGTPLPKAFLLASAPVDDLASELLCVMEQTNNGGNEHDCILCRPPPGVVTGG